MDYKNALYYGDNLEILRKFAKDESVDLCYIDPPFNSNRDYFQIYNGVNEGADVAQAKAFIDTWEWNEHAELGLYEIEANEYGRFAPQTINLIKGLMVVFGCKAMMAYLIHITLRAVEIRRVLKSTGSFYLHCDPTASHYLKVILDTIFVGQGGEFRNELLWLYATGGTPKTQFASKHDVILFYTKSKGKKHTFNVYKDKSYVDTLPEPHTPSGKALGTKRETKKYDQRLYREVHPRDWIEIKALFRNDPERLGYPTQKPEKLLERIIQASTNEGDVVMDAYCGCGTTVAVAQKLGRRWVGIDITYQSISLIKDRMANTFPDQWKEISQSIYEHGMPKDAASLESLISSPNDRLHKELEKWAVLTFSQDRARINDKKGGDGGIDGIASFFTGQDMKSGKYTHGTVLFQAKCNKGTPEQIRAFRTNMKDANASIGFFLHHGKPSQQMKEWADKEGYYENPLFPGIKIKKVQFVSLQEIVDGKRMDLPQIKIESPIKHAQAIGDANGELFDDFGLERS